MNTIFQKLSRYIRKKSQEPKVKKEEQVYKKSEPERVQEEKMHQEMMLEAQAKAKEVVLEAKDEAFGIKQKVQSEIDVLKQEIERKLGSVDEKEKQLNLKANEFNKKLKEVDEVKVEQLQKLERVAGLSKDQAKQLILNAWEEKLKEDVAKVIRESEEKAKEEAESRSKEIIVDAMRHGATNYVAEYTVSTVKVKDEEMKGRIIGKEGRNIRAFEQVTGVDVDLDEEGVIRLSSFDSVRREIAKVSLERLIADGRIQPVKIEELVNQTKRDVEKIMFTEGEKLSHMVGVYNLPRELIALLGRFKYRFSYGQNMIAHTLEETKIGIALAEEVKADVNVVRLGCLFHDIGKVITDEEGTHVQLGVDVLKKYGMPQAVIDCVAQHHEDTPFTSVESVLVYIADAISGARPGARYEDIEGYIKRLTTLEEIAKSYKGVDDVYAYQAGRELRIIVEPKEVDDASCVVLAQKVKEEIEKKLTYPGHINVTVIRESRFTEIAK